MRPRPRGLGNTLPNSRRNRTRVGFNEAETKRPRKCPFRVGRQYGSRCFNEAETKRPRKCAIALARLDESLASMRPRPRGLGNVVRWRHVGRPWAASMRPRPRGLGNGRSAALGLAMRPCFNEAETKRPRKLTTA